MGIGVGVILLAIGAILAFAVEVETRGIDLNVVGVILMIVGSLSLLLSLMFWSSFAPFGASRRSSVEEHYPHDHLVT